jgi:hypothetical protein
MFQVFFSFSGWGETESTWYVGHCWPIVRASDDRWWLWSSRWNEDLQGTPKYSEKTCPSATLSTTDPTWPDLGSNPGRRGGKPATNRLSYGTAMLKGYVCIATLSCFINLYTFLMWCISAIWLWPSVLGLFVDVAGLPYRHNSILVTGPCIKFFLLAALTRITVSLRITQYRNQGWLYH